MKSHFKILFIFAIFNFVFAKNALAAVPSRSILSNISIPKDSLITYEEAQNLELSLAQREARSLIQQARVFANLAFVSILLMIIGLIVFDTGTLFFLAILLGAISSVASIIKLTKVQRYFNKYKDLAQGNNLKEIFTFAIVRTVLASIFSALWLFIILFIALAFGFDEIGLPDLSSVPVISGLGFLLFLLFDYTQFKTRKKIETKP
jgi:hypothetical protein